MSGDYGYCPFKTPPVFENKHLKATVSEYFLNGSLGIHFLNKTDAYEDEYIYIYMPMI